MAKRKGVHVTPKGDKWQVKKEGAQRATSTHDTQAGAWDAGRRAAKADKTEAYLHNRKGQIRERNSYGDDPHPPRG